MKFTKIRLNGLSIVDLPILDALPSDTYILKSVDGLGPPDINVSIADTLNAGGVYQGSNAQSREIVLVIGLNPDYSVGQTASDLRSSLYGMLTPGLKNSVLVQVMDANVALVETVGYSKHLEINPFSKDPEVQLTISCLKQYLEAPNLLFIAPVSKVNPSIDNVGTASAGFHMEVIFTANVANWILTDDAGDVMEFVFDFLIGDTLTIDTRPGLRSILLTRAGVTTNFISALSAVSDWHMFHGGVNVFSTSDASFNWGDVYYLPQYWGI